MGLDGGTKITRSDVLRGQSWRMAQADTSRSTRGGSVNQVFQERQLNAQIRRAILWSTCALSGLPLLAPLVADALGQLMNRQAVLEHLLAARSSCGSKSAQLRYNNQIRVAAGAWDHLKSMKDVFAVHPTANSTHQQQQHQQPLQNSQPHQQQGSTGSQPEHPVVRGGTNSSNKGDGSDTTLWICPVTLLPCDGKQPFSALKGCGHVLSDKALAEVSAADRRCPVCEAPFDQAEVVLLNGSSEHMDAVRQKLRAEAAAKAAAKAVKQKKRGQLCLRMGDSCAQLALPCGATAVVASSAADAEQPRSTKSARLSQH